MSTRRQDTKVQRVARDTISRSQTREERLSEIALRRQQIIDNRVADKATRAQMVADQQARLLPSRSRVAGSGNMISTIPPVVDAGGPYSGTVDTPIALLGSLTPGTGGIDSILWTIGPGSAGSGVFSAPGSLGGNFTPDTVGTYNLVLTVDPDDGPPVADNASLESEAVAYLVFDSFADADSTQIIDHTPDVDTEGGGWQEDSPNGFIISGNKAEADFLGMQYCWIDTGASDVTLTGKVAINSDSVGVGLCWRAAASGNFYSFWIRGDDEVAELLRFTGGSRVALDTQNSVDPGIGTEYDCQVQASGTIHIVTIDGLSVSLAAVDGTYSTNNMGLFSWRGGHTVDDFGVVTL
jgi:hypothetical protein